MVPLSRPGDRLAPVLDLPRLRVRRTRLSTTSLVHLPRKGKVRLDRPTKEHFSGKMPVSSFTISNLVCPLLVSRSFAHSLAERTASSRPAFSPEALQYNPEQLQHTAEAYQRYRASLVAKQTSQLELAKRQLSALSGEADGAKKVEEVGRPATMVHSPAAANPMPPPLSTSRQTSAHSTPATQTVALPSEPVGAGQRENYTDSARTAAAAGGKRRRGSDAKTENLGTDGKRVRELSPSACCPSTNCASNPSAERGSSRIFRLGRRGNVDSDRLASGAFAARKHRGSERLHRRIVRGGRPGSQRV